MDRLMDATRQKIVSVFGSSRPAEGSDEYGLAYEVGKQLARAGFAVCNGGYSGTMAASAKGAHDAGGETIGVTAHIFPKPANRWIKKELRMQRFEDRLFKLVELGDAYVVLKGGTGTLLELAYVWETMNKGFLTQKPIVVVGGFWDQVIETLRAELIWEGIGDCTKLIVQAPTPEQAASFILKSLAPTSA